MSAKKTSPGRFPHFLGVLGFALSLCSLVWQVFTYKESHAERLESRAERVIARISIRHTYDKNEGPEAAEKSGDVSVEVVNIGQQSLYLREVSMEPCQSTVGREARGLYPREPDATDLVRLEPSVSKIFWMRKWTFDEIPLVFAGEEPQEYCVVVQSTKGEILRSPAGVTSISVVSSPLKPKARNR